MSGSMIRKELPAESKSYWIDSTPETNYPPLKEDITVDVAVIGGGLAGISTAWMLKQEGMRVAVIEADRICQGTTAYSTAKITSQHNLIYDQVAGQFGEELARQYAEANESAIQVMAGIIEELSIDCDFEWKPAYVYTQQDRYVDKINNEARTAADLGIKASYLDRLELPFPVKAAVRFDGQAQFHPRKYVLALAEQFARDSCHIFEQTRAVGIEEGNPNLVLTKGGKRVTADRVVVASHFPFHDGLGLYFARMYPDRSYVLALRSPDQLAEGMYVTAESPGRSLRSQRYKDQEIILVGGEHHKTGHGSNMQEHYRTLGDFAGNTFTAPEVLYRWSTQDYTSIDKIPYIGYIRSGVENVYVATGFKKWGISTSTVSALLIRDLIVKGESPWQDVFSPARGLKLDSAGQWVKQNVHVTNLLVTGKLKQAEVLSNVKEGEGKVVAVEDQKAGAYRDEQGNLHIVDCTCTHLGCETKWNNAEKTWDCPCHGSRFTFEGDVVEGPAFHPLQHISQGPNPVDPDII